MKTVLLFALSVLPLLTSPAHGAEPPAIAFHQDAGRLRIRIGDAPFADYVFTDRVITRPYFANIHGPVSTPLTRTHPPVKGKDATDHDTMHPGVWLAFGDLSGHDYWRNRARVRHEKFAVEPRGAQGEAAFTVINSYLSNDGKTVVARETCRWTTRVRPEGYLLTAESTFARGDADCVFGDQEEMGFGVRLATALTVKAGGEIRNSDKKRNEPEVWGKQADWCEYSGILDGKRAGILLMPDPANFRRSWFHARDYGVLVANPFGQQAFTRGARSRVAVKEGEPLRLRFGILFFTRPDRSDLDAAKAYRDYLELLKL